MPGRVVPALENVGGFLLLLQIDSRERRDVPELPLRDLRCLRKCLLDAAAEDVRRERVVLNEAVTSVEMIGIGLDGALEFVAGHLSCRFRHR